MNFYLIGINYNIVPRKVLEEAYRLRNDIVAHWQRANRGKIAVLVTCNRLEIYGVADTLIEAKLQVNTFRKQFKDQYKNAYILYGEKEIFKHGLRLACGLESQIQGEPHILQQLDEWRSREEFPFIFTDLWDEILALAKQIRIEAGLDNELVNIAALVFDDLLRKEVLTKETEIIVIGTGKVAEFIAKQRPQRGHFIFVANKKRSKAQRLAEITGGEALLLKDLPSRLEKANVIITATSSPHYVLGAKYFANVSYTRKRPLYIYDLAMPSDVEPVVGRIPFVKLQNVDELWKSFSYRNTDIIKRIVHAEELINKELINARTHSYWYKTQFACVQAS